MEFRFVCVCLGNPYLATAQGGKRGDEEGAEFPGAADTQLLVVVVIGAQPLAYSFHT